MRANQARLVRQDSLQTVSPQRAPESKRLPAAPGAQRSLAGATILQIVPSLRDDPAGHAAVDIALTMVKSGARSIVAGDGGPLVGELRAFGVEWRPMPNDTFNPLTLRTNALKIASMIAHDRIDIVHAQSPGAAWSALKATRGLPVRLVTSFPDRVAADSRVGSFFRSALARGNRVIAPSSFVSFAMMERYGIPHERITVIPRAVDTVSFSPAAVSGERIAAMRRAWGILPHMRIVVVPGRLAPWNGQMAMLDAARLMMANGDRNTAFVFAGDDRSQPRYVRALKRRARLHGIDTLCRFVGRCADMPCAIATADVVVIPAFEPPLSGRDAAQAQAMGRPVIVHAVGVLPENVLCPPRMPEELRTGWVVRPGHAGDLARAVKAALSLDRTAYDALGARARQFAEFMFSPPSVAEAIRGVYTSLLARDR